MAYVAKFAEFRICRSYTTDKSPATQLVMAGTFFKLISHKYLYTITGHSDFTSSYKKLS